MPYSGEVQGPKVVYKGKALREGVDFTWKNMASSEPRNSGNYEVMLVGMGDFVGSNKAIHTIVPTKKSDEQSPENKGTDEKTPDEKGSAHQNPEDEGPAIQATDEEGSGKGKLADNNKEAPTSHTKKGRTGCHGTANTEHRR